MREFPIFSLVRQKENILKLLTTPEVLEKIEKITEKITEQYPHEKGIIIIPEIWNEKIITACKITPRRNERKNQPWDIAEKRGKNPYGIISPKIITYRQKTIREILKEKEQWLTPCETIFSLFQSEIKLNGENVFCPIKKHQVNGMMIWKNGQEHFATTGGYSKNISAQEIILFTCKERIYI